MQKMLVICFGVWSSLALTADGAGREVVALTTTRSIGVLSFLGTVALRTTQGLIKGGVYGAVIPIGGALYLAVLVASWAGPLGPQLEWQRVR